MEDLIKGCYGGIRLSREEYEQKKKAKTLTKSEEEKYHYPGPFSFKEYLEYILQDTTWGEELLIVAMSQRWQITITVVHGESLRESRVRHNRPLDEVDLVLVYCGNNHYVGASKYPFSILSSCRCVCVCLCSYVRLLTLVVRILIYLVWIYFVWLYIVISVAMCHRCAETIVQLFA